MKFYLYVFEFKHDMTRKMQEVWEELKGVGLPVKRTSHNVIDVQAPDGQVIRHWFVSSQVIPHALNGILYDRVYINELVKDPRILDEIRAGMKGNKNESL